MVNSKMLTVKEVRERLNVKSVHTVYRQIKRGNLTAVNIGRSLKVPEDELEAYIERNKTKKANYNLKKGRPRRSSSFPAKRERRPEWVV